MTRPSAVPALAVFDLGSTLVKPSRGYPSSRLANELGLSESQASILNYALMTTDFSDPAHVATFIEAEFVVRDALHAVTDVWRAQEGEAEPADGAIALIEQLAHAGVRLAVMSNVWRPYRDSIWSAFEGALDRHVPADLQWLSFQRGVMKPSATDLAKLVATAGCRPDESVFVGDSYATDLAPALYLGMRTVWVLERPDRETNSLTAVLNQELPRPDHTCVSLAGLAGHLLHEAE